MATITAASIVTVTDKSTFSVSILDKSRYDALDSTLQPIFIYMRNAFLEVLPLNDLGGFDDLVLKYAENYAFISLQAFTELYSTFDKKITALEKKIETLTTNLSSLTTATTATT